MPVTSTRTIGMGFTGAVNAPNLVYPAASNTSSPGAIENRALIFGANTITVPEGSVAATIIPPAANTVTMQLKGINGDTGIRLHPTDPSSISIDIASSPTFVIETSGAVIVRIIWT